MYVADNLSDALSVTRRYVGALGSRGWLKLGVVVLLLGGLGFSGHLFRMSFGPIADVIDDPTGATTALALLGAGVGVLAVFWYVSAVLEFVFVESLRSDAVRFRRDLRANLRRGLWLLLFRVSLVLSAIAALGIVVLAVAYTGDLTALEAPSADDFTSPEALSTAELALVALTAIGSVVGWYAVETLTTAFVVPIMLLEDRGPIGGWRRFASAMRSNPAGPIGFLVVAWAIGGLLWFLFAAIGFGAMFVGILLFAVVALVLTAVHQSLSAVAVLLFLLGYLGYQYVVALVAAPVRSYVRYHALLILGDTSADLDLIPERRSAVRAEDGPTGADRSTARDRSESTWEWAGPADDRRRPASDGTDPLDRDDSTPSRATDETRTEETGTDGDADGADEYVSWDGPSSWDELSPNEPRRRDEPTSEENSDDERRDESS